MRSGIEEDIRIGYNHKLLSNEETEYYLRKISLKNFMQHKIDNVIFPQACLNLQQVES